MKIKIKIRFLILVSYLIITFIHQLPRSTVIIGLHEFVLFFDINYLLNSDSIYFIGLMLLLYGQIFLIYSLIIKDTKKIKVFALIGLSFLIIALFVFWIKYTNDFGNDWMITLLTSLPFWGFVTYYIYKTYFRKKTHHRK